MLPPRGTLPSVAVCRCTLFSWLQLAASVSVRRRALVSLLQLAVSVCVCMSQAGWQLAAYSSDACSRLLFDHSTVPCSPHRVSPLLQGPCPCFSSAVFLLKLLSRSRYLCIVVAAGRACHCLVSRLSTARLSADRQSSTGSFVVSRLRCQQALRYTWCVFGLPAQPTQAHIPYSLLACFAPAEQASLQPGVAV